MIWVLFVLACASKSENTSDSSEAETPQPVPWSGGLVTTAEDVAPVRNWQVRRGIVHLHSPWSHDACDGEPLIDGSPDLNCLNDMREALCTTSMDFAYLTDHPTHAAFQPYESLLFLQEGDTPVQVNGQTAANRITCPDGDNVLWMPGIEDDLMPVGLSKHVAGEDSEENNRIYGLATPEAITAEHAAGGIVLMAHTEGKELSVLTELVAAGLQGIEIFNLHAMFDPSKREDDLGLDGFQWLQDIAPFTSAEGTGEPDLFFLGVLEEQSISVERWDALQAVGPVVGVAGTDAHQNVLPIDLRDGDRWDSYRRMLRWFSNNLLIDGAIENIDPSHTDAALSTGRAYVAFEILGTPTGFDFHLIDPAGTVFEMGSDAPEGTLSLTCPTLSAGSPTNLGPPTITATIFKDGQPWSTDCGEISTDGPGVYRVRVDIIPNHLTDWLGEDPNIWLQSYPWVYSNPIRVQ